MSAPKVTPRRVTIPSKPAAAAKPSTPVAAPAAVKPSAPLKPATPTPPAANDSGTPDSVKLDQSESAESGPTDSPDIAKFLNEAYGDDSSKPKEAAKKSEASAPKEAEGSEKPGGPDEAKSEDEARPFFGSPGQLYSPKHQAEGGDVKEFQQMLGIDQSGKFDEGTTDAVKAFQAEHGLKEDGILGPDTIKRLNASKSPEGSEAPEAPGGAYQTKKDGSVYHALMEKGFTETEIANGKLVEETRRLNPDLESSHLKSGTSLQMPIRRERQPSSDGDHAVGLQGDKLDPGQSQTAVARNNDLGIGHESALEKSENGELALQTEAKNKANPDAGLKETTKVGEGGVLNTASSANDDRVVTETVAENADGTAGLKSALTSTPDGSRLDVQGLGGEDDTSFDFDGSTATIADPGSEAAGDVTKKVDLTESSDGPVEQFMGGVSRWLGHEEQTGEAVKLDGLSDLSISKDTEGRSSLSATKDGETSEHELAPGDTDDSLLERGGEFVDEAWEAGKEKLFGLLESLLGGERPSKEAGKSAVR